MTIQEVLNVLGSPDAELSVLIVDDPQIAELNKEYLHREGPTNVIAFPQRDEGLLFIPEPEEDMPPELLGDVVISADTAAREADMGGIPMEERFTQLLVHGILHLFGYDHENDKEEAARMEARSESLLGWIKNIEGNEL
ncbi:rRNA maturation RNase YbeY [Desulfobacterales bacterium HSG2]|nr:rRNA maturation RNase YbeY [Desulfobacterales bacterium HSG2]